VSQRPVAQLPTLPGQGKHFRPALLLDQPLGRFANQLAPVVGRLAVAQEGLPEVGIDTGQSSFLDGGFKPFADPLFAPGLFRYHQQKHGITD
jgi:hypothetical protein